MTYAVLSTRSQDFFKAKGMTQRRRSRTALQDLMPGHRFEVFTGSMSDTRKTTAFAASVEMAPPEVLTEQDPVLPPRLPEPQEELPFTLSDIRRAIPQHCFERDIGKSFSYLIGDLMAIGGLVYASTFIDALPVMTAVKYGVLWPMYWFWVSAFGVGLWIVAHECGHGAFSKYTWLNDLVGFFGHSILLVPYFSWKHSHRRHHANTGSTTSDEAFVPAVRDRVLEDHAVVDPWRFNAVTRFFGLGLVLVFGFPLYLLMNLGGRTYKGWANHYNPWSPVFLPRERIEVLLSDLGLITVICGLYVIGQTFGFPMVLKTYIVPYFVVHAWLVLITFLHHSHPECPHYDDNEFTWLKGALSTVDRSFGFLNIIFHRITDTHVIHHLFSQIPHYHALEATEAIKPVIGSYYKSDDRHVLQALWEDFRDTNYVAPDREGDGVLWYRR